MKQTEEETKAMNEKKKWKQPMLVKLAPEATEGKTLVVVNEGTMGTGYGPS